MKRFLWPAVLLILYLLPQVHIYAQDSSKPAFKIREAFTDPEGGTLSLGARNDINIFTAAPKSPGIGAGGSFRLQILDRLNTEWFGDYISSSLYNKAHRVDAHIGWNVMFYLLKPNGFERKFTPFIAAGHCFDYTGISLNGENQKLYSKWTSAVQMSVGCHYNITPRFDISLSTLYDLHLGKDLDTDLNPDGMVSITESKGAGWEGHVMIIISAHYKICKLWNVKKRLG